MNILGLKKIRSREIASHPRVVAALKTGVRRWISLRGFFSHGVIFFLKVRCVWGFRMLKGEKEKRTKICKMNIYCLKKIRSREKRGQPEPQCCCGFG